MGKTSPELNKLREKIDALDTQLLELLNRRAQYALDVAGVKRDENADAQCYRPEREAKILRRLVAENKGPLSEETVVRLFREITSVCRALEDSLKIGYLGPPGTFTEEAARKHFGNAVETVGLKDIKDIFCSAESREIAYGVVPVENSIEGVVTHTLDEFITSPLRIVGEIHLTIHQNLLSTAADMGEVKEVFGHRQALAQCRRWLTGNLPHIRQTEVSSSSEATKRALNGKGSAAVAGEGAAKHYEVPILARKIEDQGDNTTRFLIVGDHDVAPSGEDKTSLLVSLHNRPGALVELLKPLQKYDVSMTRIESRPAGRANWEYVFFIDVQGHREDDTLKKALDELKAESSLFKLLGSYPRATV